ncbi:MAG: DUF433 domain-containing protein [Planctomycetes bacterium]|nr:DUF433 domain-containing protein [Planctomycetota bacterium]
MAQAQHEVTEKRHITTDDGVCGGKPCIAGTRIRVWDVHVWHDLHGMTPEEIVAEFPQVTVADVHAALTYYHDNREALGRQNQRSQELVDQLRTRYPSKVQSGSDRDAGGDSVSS